MSVLIPPYGQGVYGLGLYVGPQAMSVQVTSPAYGGTITNPGFLITWDRTYLTAPSAQNDYRIRIYDTDGTSILFDSGLVVSSTESYAVPDDWPIVANVDLFIRVNVTDVNGYSADSGFHLFQAAYTAPPIITDLTVTPVITDLPHLRLNWTAPDTTGFTFIEQRVYRRTRAATGPFGESVAAGAWIRIARLPSASTVLYRDYNAAAGVEYEYAVTQRGSGGGITVESPKQSPPPFDELVFPFGYLHDPANPAIYTTVYAREINTDQRQQQAVIRARGRREDTVFVGEGFARTYAIQGIEYESRDNAAYQRLRVMLDRQFAGAVYCLRMGETGDKVFGTLSTLSRNERRHLLAPGVTFTEIAYTEAV